AAKVAEWRGAGYPHDQHPAVAEIFDWALDSETGQPRYLRAAQLRALETYWYLRLVERTPHVFDLYRRYFPRQSELLATLGLNQEGITKVALDEGADALWERIQVDDEFVRSFHLESIRETLTRDYPSYILALAM